MKNFEVSKRFIDSLLENSGVPITENEFKKAVCNFGNSALIKKVLDKAINGEKVTLCAFGGSITQGAGFDCLPIEESKITTKLPFKNYFQVVCDWWQEVLNADICAVNAGIGATDTVIGTHRIGADVFAHNPDLVILEWDCNDSVTMINKQGTYESIIRKLLEKEIAVVMFSMATSSGASSQELHEPLAKHYNLPMVSYRDAFIGLEEYKFLTNDTVHPNVTGHALAGVILNKYFERVLMSEGDLDNEIPKTSVHSEATIYDGADVVNFSDIFENKVEGIKLLDKGSFVLDTQKDSFSSFREYYGITAAYSEEYKPMVLEIESVKTLFLLVYRNSVFSGANFEVELDGKTIESPTFTCKHGGDNEQIEWHYHWATERICYNEVPRKSILKITPKNTNKDAFVRLYALLLS